MKCKLCGREIGKHSWKTLRAHTYKLNPKAFETGRIWDRMNNGSSQSDAIYAATKTN
jgi:hypothetical protein